MKDFLKNNKGDIIWYLLIICSVVIGVFVDTNIGIFGALLIGLHFYIGFACDKSEYYDISDKIGVGFIIALFHIFGYLLVLVAVSSVIDKKEIKVSTSYEVKFLENEKIVLDTLEVIDNPRSYWECRAKNCKNIIITNISTEPVNPIYSKNLPRTLYQVYSVE